MNITKHWKRVGSTVVYQHDGITSIYDKNAVENRLSLLENRKKTNNPPMNDLTEKGVDFAINELTYALSLFN